MRKTLIKEEYDELIEAIDNHNLEQISKELCDLIYVCCGTAVTMGIPLDACFMQVHQSNMSKLGPNGKPLYRADGKVLKGPNYKEADMSIIWDHSNEQTPREI